MGLGLNALGRGHKSARVVPAACHCLGGAVGGTATGALVAGLGYLVGIETHRLIGLVAGTVGTVILTLATRGRPLGIRCQVPRSSRLSTSPHYLWWGGLLGTGLATTIPHSSVVVLLLAVAGAGIPVGATVGGLYGATRAVVAVVLACTKAGSRPSYTMQALATMGADVRRTNLAAVIVAAVLLPLSFVLWGPK
jgi:hypothetical protein